MRPSLTLLSLALGATCFCTASADDKIPPPPAETTTTPSTNAATPGRGRQGGGNREGMLDEYFKRMDTNGDGKVSKEEFMAFHMKELEERFKRIDANGDGYIDKSELKQAMKTMRGAGGEGGTRLRERMQERRQQQESGGVRKKPDSPATNSN